MPLHATDRSARTFRSLSDQDIVLYVRPDGSDDNDGLTEGSAFASLAAALFEVDKDFRAGTYTIDVTGCTLTDGFTFPQVRGLTRNKHLSYEGGGRDSYGANFKGAVNIRATPTLVSTVLLDNVSYSDKQIVATVNSATWVENEHKGRFVRTSSGELLPIASNDGINLFLACRVMGVAPGLSVDIVELSASFVGSSEGQFLFGGINAAVSIYGVKFTMGGGESIFVQNCTDIIFEGCAFLTVSGRVQAGGTGIVRFDNCFFSTSIRFVGGKLTLFGCAFTTGFIDYGSSYIDNQSTYFSRVSIDIMECYIEDFGWLGTSCESTGAAITIRDCHISTWDEPLMGAVVSVDSSYIGSIILDTNSSLRDVNSYIGSLTLNWSSTAVLNGTALITLTINGVDMTSSVQVGVPSGVAIEDPNSFSRVTGTCFLD